MQMNGGQEIDGRRAALSSDKRALLRARLQGRACRGGGEPVATIPKRPQSLHCVLSFAQQRLWFLDQLVQGSAFYTESSAVRVHAALSVPAFEQALNEIVRRHEVLRTTFRLIGDQPVATVSSELHLPLEVVDLTSYSESERQGHVVRLATGEARKPFDLERGPLLRTTLLRLRPGEWVFLLSMHHIVCDGWSSTVFSRELAELYSAFVAGKPSPLEELAIQYADFAHWQREWLQGGVLERQLAYWRQQLADLPMLELPADRPHPPVFSYLGAHHNFFLPGSLVRALERLGQREGATLFMTLLSGFNILLHRYTNQVDLVVGVPVANRNRAELESLIGFFVNVLVMRSDLSGSPTLREVLQRVKAMALDAYAHQDLPFETLVEALHPKRDLARNPLFQVIFQLHENPVGPRPDAGALTLLEVDRATVKFDLRIDFFKETDGLRGVIEYSTDPFTTERIERFGGHLRTVYEAMARDAEQRVGDFALVSATESATLAEWGGVRKTPLDATIHSRFEEQVSRAPDAVAVVVNERSVTYAELDNWASLLAADLRRRGVLPDEPIAVSSSPGLETIVALLGILKAGGAYLPVNPAYPDERIRYMVTDARARFLVDTGDEQGRFSNFDLAIVGLGSPADTGLRAPHGHADVTPDHLAYVMYTSGSTGIPKGTCITHRAVVRLVTDADFCSMQPSETFLLLAPLTFDAATFEIWGPLLNGGRLVIYPERLVSLEDLERILLRHKVTTLWLSAGLFHQIVDNRPEMLACVKQLLAGGDVLSPRHVRSQLDRFPECKVINGYGPTENTTFTCCHGMTGSASVGDSVPIGSPIARTHVYVVDGYDQMAPIGVPGELCVTGDGLARCYLNDVRFTAERFVPDPFSAIPGRMYRTGDLVRFLPSGNLEFIGRIDNQLKIHGYRVEPAEIEKALLRHPAVQNALVLSRDRHGEDKRLTAYVVPKAPNSQDGGGRASQAIESALTANWRSLYDDLYGSIDSPTDPRFNIVGWKSSDTGEAIPVEQMREWVDSTVDRIRQSQPLRALEIGCGAGLLTHRVVPHVDFYMGTDFSAPVIERLRSSLDQFGFDSSRARLSIQSADDFSGIEPASFDVVVINSTVQYFPSADYLLSVLEGSVRATAAGGRIFIGDIRSLPHLEPFHTEVQLARADEGLACAELLRRIGNAVQLERELVLAPEFFEALPHQFGRITHVDVQWKRGFSDNELTRYRYDAVLYVESQHRRATGARQLDWSSDHLSVPRLAELLEGASDEIVMVHGVPNDRVYKQMNLWRYLTSDSSGTIRELRSKAGLHRESMPRLEEIWRAAEGTPFAAHLRSGKSPEHCVVRYVRRDHDGSAPLAWDLAGECFRGAWGEYSNNPLKSLLAERLAPSLRKHVKDLLPEYMLPSAYVVVDRLPLTRNGKVDRSALTHLGVEQPAAAARYVPAQSGVETRLSKVWTDVLGVERVGMNDNFFELGGDSILCIQVVSRAKAAGVHITVKQLFENQTIAQLAAVATESLVVHADQEFVTGPALLTPAQVWLLEQNLHCVDHFNQSILLEVPRALNTAALDGALNALVRHHDVLRLRCNFRGKSDHAFYSPWERRAILEQHDLSRLDRKLHTAALERHCASVQSGLNIAAGPLLRAVLYDLGAAQPARLLLAAHHLVVDGVSWRILLEDLWTAYGQIASGSEVTLPAKTTSMQYWGERLTAYANSTEICEALQYWLKLAPNRPRLLPVDYDGRNTVSTVRLIKRELTESETESLLVQVPQACRTQVNDVLLTALARTLTQWIGETECWFDLEGHGREPLFDDVDLSRTAGWFTSIFPVRLQVDPAANLSSSLTSVSRQLQAIPARGLSFGVLRFLSADPDVRQKLHEIPKREVSFNYLGQFGGDETAVIRGATESPGPMRDAAQLREYLIEIDSSVTNNRLAFQWSYSEGTHARETIERISDHLTDELRAIIRHCLSTETKMVPSDFPSARIENDDLERLLAKLQDANTGDL
jgi:amino acid adenylation domain-containing protein/non-ribosomal peptide synthase protein (TIGR01720 family)